MTSPKSIFLPAVLVFLGFAENMCPISPRIVASAEAAAASRLGELSAFRAIVVDTMSLVDKADLSGAKIRIKDLETSWDEAEPSLKPRASADWHTIDKAIDRALSTLRAIKPEPAACKQALTNLLAIMDRTGELIARRYNGDETG